MRLHHLRIEAFGPFAAPADIDFDDLSSAGLFLLSGATGAGKSSVLDAVCFALYGDVPGDRSTAKRLRCDQAPPMATPRVTLEATLAARRFRVVRSPAWERPKLRGDGLTTQPAVVSLSELVEGEWQPLSSRIDETGDLVTTLVGMNLAQFTQVAMLPQGRFQAFLRAKSEERHQLLQRLFRTGRFEQVERWLRERRLHLSREHETVHQKAADLVSRVSEALDVALPGSWDLHDLAPTVDDGALLAWGSELRQDVHHARAASQARAADAAKHESAARDLLERARTEVERRAGYDRARVELDALLADADAHDATRHRLDAAERALPVVPLQRMAISAAAEADAAGTTARTALATLTDALPDEVDLASAAAMVDLADEHAHAAAAVRALQPRAQELARAGRDLADLTRRRQGLVDDLAATHERQAPLPERVSRLQGEIGEARDAAARLEVVTAAIDSVAERLGARGQAERLRLDLREAEREWYAARDVTIARREHLVALQTARIDGMAAELAVRLTAGCSCPVCGSDDHPRKAAPAPDAPDAASERVARTEIDDAALVEHAFGQKVRDLESSLAAAEARAGEAPADELRRDHAELGTERRLVHTSAARLPALLTELETTEHTRAELEARASALATDEARADARHAALTTEITALRAEVGARLDGSGHPDLESLLAHHRRVERLAREAQTHRSAAATARRSAVEAERTAEEAAAAAGFGTASQALAASLEPRTRRELAEAYAAHVQRRTALEAILAEPDATALLGTPPPDVPGLTVAHRQAQALRDGATAEQRLWATREARLGGLLGDLDQLLTAWRPLRDDLALVTRLSSFVEGKSIDNLLRMRLSAYVLAYRLSQVVAAANERLARMSDQRYSLEHTGRRGAGETRGGLSLLVRDDWSGEARDPATLSGGETFVVSLALALGLSDVITDETGGAALDTLFVDEGFGSLDADTLDDVMDTLDSLRDGGRVVGLVSHVAEMRDRIPTQLVVTKARTGSTVAVRR